MPPARLIPAARAWPWGRVQAPSVAYGPGQSQQFEQRADGDVRIATLSATTGSWKVPVWDLEESRPAQVRPTHDLREYRGRPITRGGRDLDDLAPEEQYRGEFLKGDPEQDTAERVEPAGERPAPDAVCPRPPKTNHHIGVRSPLPKNGKDAGWHLSIRRHEQHVIRVIASQSRTDRATEATVAGVVADSHSIVFTHEGIGERGRAVGTAVVDDADLRQHLEPIDLPEHSDDGGA